MPAIKKVLKVATLIFIAGVFTGALISPADAAPVPATTTCSITPNIVNGQLESLQDFLNRAELSHPLSNQKILCKPVYSKALANFQTSGDITSITSFNDRYNQCTGSSINPVVGFKCGITVATLPKVQVLKQTYKDTYDFLSNRTPTGYATEVLHFGNIIQDQWRHGFPCDPVGGIAPSLKWNYQVGDQVKDLNIVIPCQPPTALKPIRHILQICVFMMFIYWCWNRYEEIQNQIALNSPAVYGPENKPQHDYGFWGE